MKKRAKTADLPGMPTRTGAGKAALEFVNLRKDLSSIQEQLDKKGQELTLAMKKEGRISIIVENGEGTKYTVSTISSERITCRKETAGKPKAKGDESE